MLFRMRRLQGDWDFPQTKQAAAVAADSLDTDLDYAAIKNKTPAHRGWCLVQPPRRGVPRAGGAVWGSQIGTIWTSGCGIQRSNGAGARSAVKSAKRK
jgi:hypothetical protein